MCLIDDADPNDFYCESFPKARRQHKCSECFRTINPGEQYTRTSAKFDGVVKTYKMCQQCRQAAKWLEKHCGGWCHSAIQEELQEHYSEGYREDGLQSLVIGISRGWKAFRGDGLLEVPKTVANQ